MPRKKEGRAARLAAMMEKDGNASAISLVDGGQADAAGGDLPNGSADNLKENALPGGDAHYEAKSDYGDDGDYLGMMEGEMRKGGFAAANLGL